VTELPAKCGRGRLYAAPLPARFKLCGSEPERSLTDGRSDIHRESQADESGSGQAP